jgi:hypothetical protein
MTGDGGRRAGGGGRARAMADLLHPENPVAWFDT